PSPASIEMPRTSSRLREERHVGSYRLRQLTGSVDVGRTFGLVGTVRAGVFGGRLSTDRSSGLFPLPELHDWTVGLRGGIAAARAGQRSTGHHLDPGNGDLPLQSTRAIIHARMHARTTATRAESPTSGW
ncbi:MAG: hypothetical protein PVF43_16070, partial [Candidatus Eiseniibacteriota bacterium]